MNTTDWYKEKRQVWYKMEDLRKLVEAEERVMSPEEHQTWNELNEKMEEIAKHIEVLEKMKDMRSELNEPVLDGAGKKIGNVEERAFNYQEALNVWIRKGTEGLTAEQRDLIRPGKGPKQYATAEAIDLRAIGALSGGSSTYATDVVGAIEATRRHYFGWEDACTVLRTGKGNQINWPTTADAASYTGALEATGTDAFESSDAVTLSSKPLNAYIYSSQGIGVGYDELEDADFDIATAIGTVLGERLWRAIATIAMTGTGSSQPQGLARAAGKGLLMGNCTIDYARMIQFSKTLDWAYLSGPKSGYMFHQSQFWDVMSLVATTGQPLWQPSMAAGAPPTFMGLRYWVANELTATSTVSALSRHMLMGDFSKFILRYAGPTVLLRLNEAYMKQLQVGFMALQRFDSELLNPNTTTYSPVKYLRRIST